MKRRGGRWRSRGERVRKFADRPRRMPAVRWRKFVGRLIFRDIRITEKGSLSVRRGGMALMGERVRLAAERRRGDGVGRVGLGCGELRDFPLTL